MEPRTILNELIFQYAHALLGKQVDADPLLEICAEPSVRALLDDEVRDEVNAACAWLGVAGVAE